MQALIYSKMTVAYSLCQLFSITLPVYTLRLLPPGAAPRRLLCFLLLVGKHREGIGEREEMGGDAFISLPPFLIQDVLTVSDDPFQGSDLKWIHSSSTVSSLTFSFLF